MYVCLSTTFLEHFTLLTMFGCNVNILWAPYIIYKVAGTFTHLLCIEFVYDLEF